jgi:hypothetical protein
MFGFSQSSTVTGTPYAYPNLLNKSNDPLRMQVPNYFGYPLIFVDASENLIMADDVVTPSNPPIAPIEKEEFEETSLDVNVSQWSCEEEPCKIVVCT